MVLLLDPDTDRDRTGQPDTSSIEHPQSPAITTSRFGPGFAF